MIEISRDHFGLPEARSRGTSKPILVEVTETACHICVSHTRQAGYPVLRTGRDASRRLVSMARLLLAHHIRPLTKGEEARHKCHNRACINLDHLLIGTHAENMRDSVEAGRTLFGERIANSKVTDAQAEAIRTATGVRIKDLAAQYGITPVHVWQIRSGRRRQSQTSRFAESADCIYLDRPSSGLRPIGK